MRSTSTSSSRRSSRGPRQKVVMFADTSLAARIDAAEAALCAAVARYTPGAAIPPLGGGLAVLARRGSPVNKIAGVGFDGALDPAALEVVEAVWRARGEAV